MAFQGEPRYEMYVKCEDVIESQLLCHFIRKKGCFPTGAYLNNFMREFLILTSWHYQTMGVTQPICLLDQGLLDNQ